MNAANCPQCVAEQRVRYVRLAMNATALLTIGVGLLPCVGLWSMNGAMDVPWAFTVQESVRAERLGFFGVTHSLLLACVVGVLGLTAGRFGRRAATPLSPPAIDPTAHYRQRTPAECPRHPFAR